MGLMTMEEFCEEYRVPLPTARYWRHKGSGPRSFRMGRRVMYRRQDVEAWVEEQIAADSARHEVA